MSKISDLQAQISAKQDEISAKQSQINSLTTQNKRDTAVSALNYINSCSKWGPVTADPDNVDITELDGSSCKIGAGCGGKQACQNYMSSTAVPAVSAYSNARSQQDIYEYELDNLKIELQELNDFLLEAQFDEETGSDLTSGYEDEQGQTTGKLTNQNRQIIFFSIVAGVLIISGILIWWFLLRKK